MALMVLWSSKLLAILLRRTTLLCCSIERVLRLSIDSAVPSKLGGLGNGPTVQQHKPRSLRNLPTCYHLMGTSNITIPKVDGGSQPAFFSRPRDVEDLSKPDHGLQRDVSMPVEQLFFNSGATPTMFFSHICRTLRSGTLSKWMRPVNRANVGFWHSTAGSFLPHHTRTPTARRPPLDEGFETEEPPHDPGEVSWNPGPLQGNTHSKASQVNIVAVCLAVCQGSGFFARPDSTTISSSAGVLPTHPNLCVVLEFFSTTRL